MWVWFRLRLNVTELKQELYRNVALVQLQLIVADLDY
jgi:hypothetical protein